MIFAVDFDGTITKQDVIDSMLQRYANDEYLAIEAQWQKNEINSQQCMKAQFSLVTVEEDEVKNFFENIEIDLTFLDFYDYVNQFATIAIVSDGVDYPIKAMIEKYNLKNIIYFANKLQIIPNGVDIAFPYCNKNCRCHCGCCKCTVLNSLRKNKEEKIVLIGDGKSDNCPAHIVDFVFAKNKLIDFCTKEQISFTKFNNFSDVLTEVKEWQMEKKNS